MSSQCLTLLSLLDPRPHDLALSKPIAEAVNIPADQLAERVLELPAKGEVLRIAGFSPWSELARDVLARLGRRAEVELDFTYAKDPPLCRLWKPNEFLEQNLPRAPGHALDLACGSGRDAVFLASAGWDVVGVDHLPDALELARRLASRYLNCEATPNFLAHDLREPLDLEQKFDLVTCFFFIDRPLISRVPSLIAPGGVFLFETFSRTHQTQFGKPRGDQAIESEEISRLLSSCDASIEEGWHGDRHTVRALAKF